MPRPPNSPYIKTHCTPAQKEAVKQAASNAGMNEGQFIRMFLVGACAEFGVVYPQNMIERGKYKRNPGHAPDDANEDS